MVHRGPQHALFLVAGALVTRGSTGTTHRIDVPCGEPVSEQVELNTGPVTAYIVSPDEDGVHKAAVGAVRILDPRP